MDVAEVGAPGGKQVHQLLLHKANQLFISLHTICVLCICAVITWSSMESKRVNVWTLHGLKMLCASGVVEHANFGELHLCPGC